MGDLGLVPGYGKPSTTAKVEKTLADFFGTEAAVLVRGAGTAAIRWGLWSMMNSGQALVVHKAPIYPTTKVTVESMHLQVVQADYNNIPALKKALLEEPVEAGLFSMRVKNQAINMICRELLIVIKNGVFRLLLMKIIP
jgi:cystathionine beta-lyase/cystathionine gamma-synthase